MFRDTSHKLSDESTAERVNDESQCHSCDRKTPMSLTLTESEADIITSPPTHHDSSTQTASSLNTDSRAGQLGVSRN